MYRELLAHSDLLLWPQIGLAIFFVTFVAVLAQVFIVHRRGRGLEHISELPLQDDETLVPASERTSRHG